MAPVKKRGQWNEYSLKLAVAAVLQNGMSKKKSAKQYSIPRGTLQRHVKKMKTAVPKPHIIQKTTKKGKGRPTTEEKVTKAAVAIPAKNKRGNAKKFFTEISVEQRIVKNTLKRGKGKEKRNSTKAGLTENKWSRVKMSTEISDESCKLCKFIYKQPDDPKADEEWLSCSKCQSWFHFSCAEGYGILDDENFTCRSCVE